MRRNLIKNNIKIHFAYTFLKGRYQLKKTLKGERHQYKRIGLRCSFTHALPDCHRKPERSTLANWNFCEITGNDRNCTTHPATHRCAIPALRTAQEMAFTAVPRALSNVVSSPVPLAFLPSSITNRVMVTTLVSKAPCSDMAAADLFRGPGVEAGGAVAGLKCSATRNSMKWKEWKRAEPIQSCEGGVALLETLPAL